MAIAVQSHFIFGLIAAGVYKPAGCRGSMIPRAKFFIWNLLRPFPLITYRYCLCTNFCCYAHLQCRWSWMTYAPALLVLHQHFFFCKLIRALPVAGLTPPPHFPHRITPSPKKYIYLTLIWRVSGGDLGPNKPRFGNVNMVINF